MRVTILGHTGSGKTTLANAISELYGIPHIQIDRYWFKHGGNKLTASDDKKEIREKVRKDAMTAIKQKDWVSDGIYRRVQPEILKKADVAIYLDVPMRSRLQNHAKRVVDRDNRHDELTLSDDLKHFRTIIKKTRGYRTVIESLLEDYPRVIVLHGRKEARKFREGLPESLDEAVQKFHGKRNS